jgi:hypothetical protein
MGKTYYVRDKLSTGWSSGNKPGGMSFYELRELLQGAQHGTTVLEYRREDSEHWRPTSEVREAKSESDLDELVKQPAQTPTFVIGHISLEKPITEQEKARYAAMDAARAAAVQDERKSESVAVAVIAATVLIILLILLLQRWYL